MVVEKEFFIVFKLLTVVKEENATPLLQVVTSVYGMHDNLKFNIPKRTPNYTGFFWKYYVELIT